MVSNICKKSVSYFLQTREASEICKKIATLFLQIERITEKRGFHHSLKGGGLDKFCIFCGAPPTGKTKEHIVPKWLLKLTGNPNRLAYFGRDWLSPTLKQRIYSWMAFTFPACDPCNSKWSHLEASVKDILDRMLNGALVSAGDLVILLDWLDKVRVGLWLGMIYLNSNYRAVIPQFHINDRVAQKDRALLIFQSDDQEKGIMLTGCDTPVFHTSPSVCLIAVNDLFFVTASRDFLLSERFGWPFAINRKMADIDTDGFTASLSPGTQKLSPPIIASVPPINGRALLQPIGHQFMRQHNPKTFVEYYSNEYVKNTSLEPEKGIGRVFVDNLDPIPYPQIPSDAWKPPSKYPRNVLAKELGLWIANLQRSLYLDMPDYSHFPDKERKDREAEIQGVVAIQDLIIKHITNGGG